jgi:hypothetical protein
MATRRRALAEPRGLIGRAMLTRGGGHHAKHAAQADSDRALSALRKMRTFGGRRRRPGSSA